KFPLRAVVSRAQEATDLAWPILAEGDRRDRARDTTRAWNLGRAHCGRPAPDRRGPACRVHVRGRPRMPFLWIRALPSVRCTTNISASFQPPLSLPLEHTGASGFGQFTDGQDLLGQPFPSTNVVSCLSC